MKKVLKYFQRRRKVFMLKVVVFDSGYGGEFFADKLEEELPIIKVIRVIDWRNAEKFLTSPKEARKIAEADLKPYISQVDLIILANHLLSLTSLKYFKRKYRYQKFLGFELKKPETFIKYNILILTTKAVARTMTFYNFTFQLKRKIKTLTLDSWPAKIDDGELTKEEIEETLKKFLYHEKFVPKEIILACSQFNDIKSEIKAVFGSGIKIYDSFDETFRRICKLLKIRGGTGKKSTQ